MATTGRIAPFSTILQAMASVGEKGRRDAAATRCYSRLMKEGGHGMRKITVLGSTGSIGVSTLNVIGQLGGCEAFECWR